MRIISIVVKNVISLASSYLLHQRIWNVINLRLVSRLYDQENFWWWILLFICVIFSEISKNYSNANSASIDSASIVSRLTVNTLFLTKCIIKWQFLILTLNLPSFQVMKPSFINTGRVTRAYAKNKLTEQKASKGTKESLKRITRAPTFEVIKSTMNLLQLSSNSRGRDSSAIVKLFIFLKRLKSRLLCVMTGFEVFMFMDAYRTFSVFFHLLEFVLRTK